MTRLFEKFLPVIYRLDPQNELTKADLIVDDFLIHRDGSLEMYYAPHNEYINNHARIVIAGITPGWNQMKTAFEQAIKSIHQKQPIDIVLKEAKMAASFSGTMRLNLIEMLDECGINEALHVKSSSSIFAAERDLLHTTSVIKYPVFYRGRNYTGHQPRINTRLSLREYAFHVFPAELSQIEKPALIIPLGNMVEDVMKELLEGGGISRKHTYLFGFPHPSGANGHRKVQFQQNREELRSKVRLWGE